MKKILTIALVALLAASTAFAGITGSASVSLGYDTTSKVYGFANGTSISANIDLATESVDKLPEEGNVIAGIKASMKLAVAPWKGDDYSKVTADEIDASVVKALIWLDGSSTLHGLGLWFSIDEAYVKGEDWTLSILGTKGAPDYAKSAIETVTKYNEDAFGNKISSSTYEKPVSYSVSAWKGTGVALKYKGYTVAGGFKGDATESTKYFAFNFFAETKSFEFDGGSVQAAAIVARDGSTDPSDSTKYTKLDQTNLGFSAKANYAKDALSASLAGDLGIENLKEAVVKFDIAANVSYSPVALDVYYKHDAKLLSAKLSGSYNETVNGSFAFKDILTESARNFSVSAEGTIDALTLGGSIDMTIANKEFEASVSGKYAAEKFTLNSGLTVGTTFGTEKTTYLFATASISSEVVIPGATLSLAYGKDSKSNKMNFLKDTTGRAQNFGAVTATCKIAF